MLKKTITFQNLDGEDVTEDFYFQITKSEIAEKAMIEGEGYMDKLQSLSVERDGAKIIDHFKDILGNAVGKRDGQLLIKDDQVRKQFMYSGAYDAFFMELLESPDSGAAVIRAMLPKDAQTEVDKVMKERGMTTVELPASAPQLEESKPMVSQSTIDQAEALAKMREEKAQPGKDEDPTWLKELRSPTRAELMKMTKEEMQLAAKMREAGVIA